MMAQSAASLDAISGGRLIIGLGTSGPLVVEHWHGQRWARPLQRTREYVEILRLALAGERVNHDGELFQLRGFTLRDPSPERTVPIMIASIGPQNIGLTGEIADGWLPIFLRRDALPAMQAILAVGAERVGRNAEDIEIAPSVLSAVSGDSAEASALVRAHIAFYVGGMGTFYNRMMRRFGWEAEAALIKNEWDKPERAGRAAAALAVTDEMVKSTSAVGTVAHARASLSEAYAVGVTLPILMFPYGASLGLMRETLEALAPSRLAQ